MGNVTISKHVTNWHIPLSYFNCDTLLSENNQDSQSLIQSYKVSNTKMFPRFDAVAK